ncbi:hypothetical protein ACOSQ4_021838 [Xanthoceras sorbifolium]
MAVSTLKAVGSDSWGTFECCGVFDDKSACGPGQEAASGPDRNVALSTVDAGAMVIEEDHHFEPSNKPNKPRWKRLACDKGKFLDNSRKEIRLGKRVVGSQSTGDGGFVKKS